MAKFIKGDIVVVPFPFSDLTQAKRRPALVVAGLMGNDFILCQITSQHTYDAYAISLEEEPIFIHHPAEAYQNLSIGCCPGGNMTALCVERDAG